jgi:hypothetical protein
MSSYHRTIDAFPYERRNAEAIIERSRKIAAAKQELLDFVSTLPASDARNQFMAHDWLDSVDFTMQVEATLMKTFPELLPIDWGFEEHAAGDVQ